MQIVVYYAAYGALAGPNDSTTAKALDVTQNVQDAINRNGGVVTIDNKTLGGDPLPNSVKHFGAHVLRDGQDVYFACREGQKIDFRYQGGLDPTQATQEATPVVLFAVYGAVPDTNIGQDEAQAADVRAVLQGLLLGADNEFIPINNTTLGGDPAPNEVKHFAAVVRRNGRDFYYACQEGQSVYFGDGGGSGH